MREIFVEDLLRMSVPQSKVAVPLRLNMLCWCTSEACKYSMSAVVSRGLPALLQEKFMSKWWHWSKVEAWNFTIKTFKTCEFNEINCWLKSEHSCSGENDRNIHVSWMMLYKEGALKYVNVETRLLFSPALIKFLATRQVALIVFTKRSCALFLIWSMWWLLVAVYYIYRNWPNLNWLSQLLSIIVSI